MQFCEKLSRLRRRSGLSQEQLADLLGVSRQSVSKWEAGGNMPELSKLIALADRFGVSVDYLVREELTEPPEFGAVSENADDRLLKRLDELESSVRRSAVYEYRSRRTLFGLPLVHVKFNYRGGMALARGIIAVGNTAVGVVSLGGMALGVASFGGFSLGLLALGGLALGGLTLGGVSIGLIAVGGMAVGIHALGGVALASEIASGGVASGRVAIGQVVRGEHTMTVPVTAEAIREMLKTQYPRLPGFLLKLFSLGH